MKILIDTNVLLSSILDNGQCYQLMVKAKSKHDIYYTDFILNELKDILLGKFKLEVSDIADIIKVIETYYTLGETSKTLKRLCRDKDDDQVLADAVKNQVDMIITGDKNLLSLKSCEHVKIISPADFLKKYL